MNCPYCASSETAVIDSRETESGESTRRRRVCVMCQRRFTTYERIESLDLKVIKKDGNKEEFDRQKVKRGLIKATWKRPINLQQIDELTADVERTLRLRNVREVKSWEIGNLVIEQLKNLDKLSYLLFASVYRDFGSLEDFKKEIDQLEKVTCSK